MTKIALPFAIILLTQITVVNFKNPTILYFIHSLLPSYNHLNAYVLHVFVPAKFKKL